MKIPAIRGIIDRRVLVNFRVDPDVLSRVCPAPFRPQLVGGFGVAGICLIRLKQIRPSLLPSFLGISSENAAHRIAVQWEDDRGTHTGVYIPRRDTSSRLNAFAGGRIFPGVHHRARFEVRETQSDYHIEMDSIDGTAHVAVHGLVADGIPCDSVFKTVSECSLFFENGSLGYSPGNTPGLFDGLELRSLDWQVRPLAVTSVKSTFFDDLNVFPAGSVTFDNALLMHDIDHQWHRRDSICAGKNQDPRPRGPRN